MSSSCDGLATAALASAGGRLVLGYWEIRGLAQPIRTLLAYTQTPFVDLTYSNDEAGERAWEADKAGALPAAGFAFPNLPFLASSSSSSSSSSPSRDDGGDGSRQRVRLTQSTALLMHVARASPHLNLLGATPAEADLCDMFLMQAVDVRAEIGKWSYGGSDAPALPPALDASLAPFEAALADGRAFVAGGDAPTVADFVLVELLLLVRAAVTARGAPGARDAFATFPRLRALVERFRALPGVAAALEKASALPWNWHSAQFK
jgi:glutathione S-transferase